MTAKYFYLLLFFLATSGGVLAWQYYKWRQILTKSTPQQDEKAPD